MFTVSDPSRDKNHRIHRETSQQQTPDAWPAEAAELPHIYPDQRPNDIYIEKTSTHTPDEKRRFVKIERRAEYHYLHHHFVS